ncbi:MAG: hypothetical protein R3F56_26455 [Planctomycetota bacterium]
MPARAPLRITGIVQEVDGGPLAQARVWVAGRTHPELPPVVADALFDARYEVSAACEARSVFRLEVPHAGPFTLWARTADGRRTGWRFPVMAGDFVTLRLRPTQV